MQPHMVNGWLRGELVTSIMSWSLNTYRKHQNTQAHTPHATQLITHTPPSPSSHLVISSPSSSLLPSPLSTPDPSFSSLHTHTPLPPLYTVSWSTTPPLDQMRTGKGVCCRCEHVCLTCCRGKNCDSRTFRHNLE